MGDFIGTDSYLPGERFRSDYGRGLSPLDLARFRARRSWSFSPKDQGDYFQQFLAIQQNPEALLSSTIEMPQTPFGRMM